MADRELQIKVTVEADQAQRQIENLNAKLKDNDGIASKTAEAEKRLDAAFKEAGKSADTAAASAARLGQHGAAAGGAMDMLTSSVMRFAAPAAIGAAIKGLIDFGGAIQDNAQKVGMAASAYDQLTQITAEFGVESGTVIQGMLTLSDRIANGDRSTVAAMQKLNLSIAEFKSASPDEMFYKLAEAVGDLNTHQERVAVLNDLGGRSFRQMAGMMSQDISRLRGELAGLDDEAAERLDRAGERIDRYYNKIKRFMVEGLAGDLELREAWADGQSPPRMPKAPKRPMAGGASNRNESADLAMGLSKTATDAMNQRPWDWLPSRGLPGSINGVLGFGGGMPTLPGVPESLDPSMTNGPDFDAAEAWFGGIEEAAAEVPPVIDQITTSTQQATAAFTEMGKAAGIALAVPKGYSSVADYADAGVGSGLFGGARPTQDAGIQVMGERTKRFLAGQFGGGGGATVNINANGAWFQNDQMIQQLARTISDALAQQYNAAKKW